MKTLHSITPFSIIPTDEFDQAVLYYIYEYRKADYIEEEFKFEIRGGRLYHSSRWMDEPFNDWQPCFARWDKLIIQYWINAGKPQMRVK
jgi:hypothetical protein